MLFIIHAMRSVPEACTQIEYYMRELNYISNIKILEIRTCKNGWRFRHESLDRFYGNTCEFVQHLLYDRLHLKRGDTILS